MILIGPGFLILLCLMTFKPIRFIVGWILFIALAFFGAFLVFALERNS